MPDPQNCRFVILSNGNLHYFWDLERGNPYIVTSFPTPESVIVYGKVKPNPKSLIDELVQANYIVLTQLAELCLRSSVEERGRAARVS